VLLLPPSGRHLRSSHAAASSACACAGAVGGPILVALTRQAGENGKLRRAVQEALPLQGVPSEAVECVEVPCIEHARGSDYAALEARLASLLPSAGSGALAGGPELGAVVLTSPEGARVFLDAWASAGGGERLPIPVACVGKGTAAVVEGAGVAVEFNPSKADAEALAAELPFERFGPRVLYPASEIAPGTLQEGLTARGFGVERLNTYTTRAVEEPSDDMLALMANTDIVTFGSPSAVKAWAKHSSRRPPCACIGGTSRTAAEAAGFSEIFSPESPGVPGWAEVTVAAVRAKLREAPAASAP